MTKHAMGVAVLSGAMAASGAIAQEVIQTNRFFFNTSGSESLPGKTVTGAPYSAEEKTTITQTLADGNRIVNTTSAKIYRDQQGRTRVERTLPVPGIVSDRSTTVVIHDPVAQVGYTLVPGERTAMKMEMGQARSAVDAAMKAAAEAKASGRAAHAGEPGKQVTGGIFGIPDKTAEEAMASGHMVTISRGVERADVQARTEDLGKQVMEGVSVQGSRSITTIPAGTMGNERQIEIVSERWYSPDLQMNIMTKRSDPRMGETVYTVSNLNRANPDASLFQVPAGYTEKAAGAHPFVMKQMMIPHER
ncbi:MAG: hypothetical protein M3Z09_09110 [Acidobacteriota bacterium]|nr:hypothetical protein [Acidobacteriota bacterium]